VAEDRMPVLELWINNQLNSNIVNQFKCSLFLSFMVAMLLLLTSA